jgi:hypothetical protein
MQLEVIMSLHTGSRKLAHNLDRFSFYDFETVAGEAARLGVSAEVVEMYMDWYGDSALTVRRVRMVRFTPRRYAVKTISLPAYEAHLRQEMLGECLVIRQ